MCLVNRPLGSGKYAITLFFCAIRTFSTNSGRCSANSLYTWKKGCWSSHAPIKAVTKRPPELVCLVKIPQEWVNCIWFWRNYCCTYYTTVIIFSIRPSKAPMVRRYELALRTWKTLGKTDPSSQPLSLLRIKAVFVSFFLSYALLCSNLHWMKALR